MSGSRVRGEARAFRLLVATVVALVVVVSAALAAGTAAAVAVGAVVSSAAVVLSLARRRPARTLRTAPAHVGAPGEHRLIVLAQAIPPADSLAELGRRASRVAVVSAASAPPLRRWASDIDAARDRASRRVDETVRRLVAANVDATGTVGDEDELRAIEDALRTFGGDEILVATGGGTREAAVAARVRERFALPVTHIVA